MTSPRKDPAFGEADLSNCDRELIQIPGSIQPHGVLVVLNATSGVIEQVTANAQQVLGQPAESLVGQFAHVLGGDLGPELERRLHEGVGPEPEMFRCSTGAGESKRGFDGLIHRNADNAVLLELEPANLDELARIAADLPPALAKAVSRVCQAATLTDLAYVTTAVFRELAGYDRVMFYRFDPEGHGEVVAESKQPYLEPYLGLHYPSTDIPPRARELYLRNRVRVLVDVEYEPVPLVPRLFPPTGADLDMSMCGMRSMSPLHLQYLKNMGVTATLVASLVQDNKLWGLVACHHYSAKPLQYALRAACDLIAEVVATRIAVLENFNEVRSAAMVRRLEGRLVESTRTHGEWQRALFEDPKELMRMTGATGTVLSYDGNLLTAGDVPSTAEIRELISWIGRQPAVGGVFSCSSVSLEEPSLSHLSPTASGVLAVELSGENGEYLIWLRSERIKEVRWAGNPHKSVLPGNSPMELSPRRSFAVWTELVHGTARPWSPISVGTARAVGNSLRDIVLQVRTMSFLIAEDRLAQLRRSIQASPDGVLIADGSGRIQFINEAFARLFQRTHARVPALEDLPLLFHDRENARDMLRTLRSGRRHWSGELVLNSGAGVLVPLAVRAESIPRLDGDGTLGYILMLTNMSNDRKADAARDRAQRAILEAQQPLLQSDIPDGASQPARELLQAVLANASLAIMEVAEDSAGPEIVPTLDGLESSTKRAADLALKLIAYTTAGIAGRPRPPDGD